MPIIQGGKVIEGSLIRPGAAENSAPAAEYGPFTNAGVPAAGYLNGTAAKGALCIDVNAGVLYTNVGTKTATTWAVVGTRV